MKHDDAGFLYPEVDASLCIECGACERVCPFIDVPSKQKPQVAFSAYLKDTDVHKRSSSGGASYSLCKNVLEKQGVVYGCAAEGLDIRHIRIDSVEDLPKIQGSKYVQSDVSGLFAFVKADLENHRKVAFVGSPCQIAGLKKYLRKPYDDLLLIDIICHGTPSLKMLREHVANIGKGRIIDNISFRTGENYIISIYSGNKLIWSANGWRQPFKDMYYRAFLSGISCRPSCHVCPFACSERVSDVTIGDFWGLKDDSFRPQESGLGTSVILPVTGKGLAAVEELGASMYLKERPVCEAISGNTQLNHPMPECAEGVEFFRHYPSVPFDRAVMRAVRRNMINFYIRKSLSPLKKALKSVLHGSRTLLAKKRIGVIL